MKTVGGVLVLGGLLVLAGLVLLFNVLGAGDQVIRRVTSRSLGDLAPGFAASRRGFRTYALLIVGVGVVCLGVGSASWSASFAAGLMILGVVVFAVASVIAIAGEVTTYKALKR